MVSFFLMAVLLALNVAILAILLYGRMKHPLFGIKQLSAESLTEGIIIINDKEIIEYVNPAIEKIFGYQPNEVIGKQITFLLPQSYNIKHLIEMSEEATGMHKSGSTFPISIKTKRINVNSHTSFIIIIQAASVVSIADTTTQFESFLLNNTSDSIFVHDFEGKMIYVNEAAWKTRGYTKEELLSLNLRELDTPDQLERIGPNMEKLKELGELTFESSHLTKDGTVMLVEIHAKILNINGKDFIVSTVRNITRRKQIDQELISSNEKFQKFFFLNPLPCSISKINGTLLYINQAAADGIGYTEAELVGRNVKTLDIWVSLDDRDAMLKQLMQTGYVNQFPTQYRRKEGRIVDILYSAQVFDIQGEKHILATIQDITEQKKSIEEFKKAKELAEAANIAKSEFLANMSHEIRTPLNTIMGMANLLMETNPTTEQQQYLNMFTKSGEHLLRMINEILDLAKIESDKLKLENTNFELKAVINKIADMAMIRLVNKNVQFSYNIADDIPQYLNGDKARLDQVLLNLVGNAAKFTEHGNIRLNISKLKDSGDKKAEKEKIELLFEVHDTGIGIPKDKLNDLFESFMQVDSSITRKYGGTGMGLAICKRVIELMGGKIWVESELGKGSSFFFTVTFNIAQQTNTVQPETPKEGINNDSNLSNATKNILLVDDSEDNRQLIKLYFKKSPQYSIDMAEDGEIAIEKVKSKKYDIIFMDIQMPVMDGYSATKLIREMEKRGETAYTPILALSASAFKEDEAKSIAAGCDEHLSKPIQKKTLLEMIKKYTS